MPTMITNLYKALVRVALSIALLWPLGLHSASVCAFDASIASRSAVQRLSPDAFEATARQGHRLAFARTAEPAWLVNVNEPD